jgi:tetratricopeptide (TPR) repeat protein
MNNSDKSEELRIRAKLHIKSQNYEAAIEDCNRLLQLTPNDSQGYWYRQIAWHKLGNNQEAIKDCNEFLKLQPNSAQGYSFRASIFEMTGNLQRALDDCNQTLSINNSDVNEIAYTLRGDIYVKLKNYQAALEDFNQSIRLDPKDIKLYQRRGRCHKDLENYHEAIIDFTEVIRRDRNYYRAYYGRGGAYMSLDDMKSAASDFDTAARLSQAQGDTEASQEAMMWANILRNAEGSSDSSISDNKQSPVPVLHVVAAILFPPLGVFLTVGLGIHFWISLVLTLVFTWIPGIIHAVWLVYNHDRS